MKKLLLSVTAVCGLMSLTSAFGQSVKVVSIDKLPTPSGAIIEVATISPDGKSAVLSDISSNSLSLFDIQTKTSKKLNGTTGAFDVTFSPDSKTIAYRQNSFDASNLRYQSVVAMELSTETKATVVEASRSISGFSLANGNAIGLDGKTLKTKKLKSNAATTSVSVGIDRGDLVVCINGKTSIINPQGERSYIWPQLSPDGTRIVYWGDGVGCFVCNLDGSNPVSMGRLHAPQWLDNETIVGMNDYDDGKNITESSIVAVTADGKSGKRLTPEGIVAIYPTTGADGTKIAFTNPRGEAYIMTLSK